MKIINSSKITSFGGINFVLSEFERKSVGSYINNHLPILANQSKYTWKDILYSYWSIFFCGGDCAEDISINLKPALIKNPLLKLPSPDRLLERFKALAQPNIHPTSPRSKSLHQFNFNEPLNQLNINLLKKLGLIKNQGNVLDYDNTFVFADKADARHTYQRRKGYCPGVGMIGQNIVYIENRNGNSSPESYQSPTLSRMFEILKNNHIHINAFRADGASYTLDTLNEIQANVDKFYIRSKMSASLEEAIRNVKQWKEIIIDEKTCYRGSTYFTPFKKIAKRQKKEELLKKYRLVITKEEREDGQLNLFTGEPYNYRAILTNDFEKTDDEIVLFYNQRGTEEREFDVLKNDFGWNSMPFSRIDQNTVYLIITAICRNLYNYIIQTFSKIYLHLDPSFRIKKFIFRFICIPAKWIYRSRQYILKIYGKPELKT